MKNKLLLVGIMLITFQLFSQNDVFQVKLKLKDKFPFQNFHIEEVIDNRLIKSNIGLAQRGLANRKVAAIFPDSFKVYIKQYFDKILVNDKGPITLIFHEFNVSERTSGMSEKGKFRMQVEFAKKVDKKYYSLWYREIEVEGKGVDVTKSHHKRIENAMISILSDFAISGWQQKEGALIELELDKKFDYTKPLKNGLYRSFNKLSTNDPFMEFGYEMVSKKRGKYPKYNVKDGLGKKINKRITYISDGKDIYIHASRYSYSSHFIKSKFVGKYIYFEDRFYDPTAVILFGMLGATMTNTVKGIVLDTETGLVTVLDGPGFKKIQKKHSKILSNYKETKKVKDSRRLAIRYINQQIIEQN